MYSKGDSFAEGGAANYENYLIWENSKFKIIFSLVHGWLEPKWSQNRLGDRGLNIW